jgi:hypothetical protein
MIVGTLLIWTVKFIVRPFIHIPHGIKPLVGLAPNLVGSFLLPFGACLFFQRFFRLQSSSDLTFTCSFGLLPGYFFFGGGCVLRAFGICEVDGFPPNADIRNQSLTSL